MELREIDLSHKDYSSSTTSFTETISIPGITSVESISTTPELRNGELSYDLDGESLTINLDNVSSTSRDTDVVGASFLRGTREGDNKHCVYRAVAGGNVFEEILATVKWEESCPSGMNMYLSYDSFEYTVSIEYQTKIRTGEYVIKTKNKIISLPVFEIDGIDDTSLRTTIDGNVLVFNLVNIDSEEASPVRVMTKNGIKAIAKE